MEYTNVMVDLETLGNVGAPILSIGAVAFDHRLQQLGPEFYEVIRLQSCYDIGLVDDPDTLAWWTKQHEDAKKILTQVTKTRGTKAITLALVHFNKWLAQFGSQVKVWGNGSDFDNAILQHVYKRCQVDPGWKFWNNRCYRTLKGEVTNAPKLIRQGIYHNALDDAKTQALHAIQLQRLINGHEK